MIIKQNGKCFLELGRSLHGLMAKTLDYDIIESDYVHFWTNTLGKDMNLFIPQIIG